MIWILLLCLLLTAVLYGSWYAYRKAFYSPYKGRDYLHAPRGQRLEPYREEMERIFIKLADRPCEKVSIFAQDGVQLTGQYYHAGEGAPLDICFHGYRSSPLTDICCFHELCSGLGHSLLLVDQRAHGTSGSRTITFGIKERFDVLSWADYADERFGPHVKTFLYGISMGASSVLMAADMGLPETVRGIIADCPYSSPEKIIRHVSRKLHYPDWLTWPLTRLGAKIYGDFDIRESNAVRAMQNSEVPILLIHGEADGFVPCEMSEEIRSANGERIEKHTFPGADHGMSFLSDPKRYQKILESFLGKC